MYIKKRISKRKKEIINAYEKIISYQSVMINSESKFSDESIAELLLSFYLLSFLFTLFVYQV